MAVSGQEQRAQAREARRQIAEARHLAVQHWVSGSTKYALGQEDNKCSALRVAVEENQVEVAKTLVASLDSNMRLEQTHYLLAELLFVAKMWPRDLVDFVELLEDSQH